MLTPLQYAIWQSRRYHQLTSVRYISTIISATILICLSVYNVTLIPRPGTQFPTEQYHISHWEEGNEQHSTKSPTHLLSTSPMGKMYYPWNIFSSNTNRIPPDMQQHQSVAPTNSDNHFDNDDDKRKGNDSDDDINNDDDDTLLQEQPSESHHHSQQHRTYANPSVYGWTPGQYPNPLHDPTRCAVAYILPHLRMDNAFTTNNADSLVPVSASLTDSSNSHPSSSNHTTTPSSDVVGNTYLRLCDPDWVLGGVYLEDVATAMSNFSNLFSRNQQETTLGPGGEESSNSNPNGKDEEWDVEVGPSTRRLRSDVITSSSHVIAHSTQDAAAIINENNFGTAIDSSFRVRAEERDESDTPDAHGSTSGGTSSASSSKFMGNNNRRKNKNNIMVPTIELAVATVRKMNLAAILRQSTNYYSYEDEDDMVNDAAQIFARNLHDTWWSFSNGDNETAPDVENINRSNDPDFGILLFLSVQDRVCFISTGSGVSSILPWWRLDHIVASMKPDLRRRDYGIALLRAIDDLSQMLQTGPPTLYDRMHDFVARFGVVIAFALFTFFFGAVSCI
jgi:TPM domain